MPLVPERGPLRTLAAGTLVNTFGNGLMFTTSALYFTRIVGLSPTQVGIGLTCSGVVAMLSAMPLGHLADRLGPRETLVAMVTAMAGLELVYTVVGSFWQFVSVACGLTMLDAGSRSARNALIARAIERGQATYARAYLRSITNIGITAGAALAGVALHFDTAAAYRTLIVVNAITYAGTAIVLLGLERVPPIVREHAASPWQALSDRPYVAMVVVSGFLALHFGLLEIGVPLWVANHTDAPRTLVSVLFVINTVSVVLFQVRATRGVDSPSAGARAMRRAGVVLFAACVLFASAEGPPRTAAIALLVAAAAVHVYGEIMQSAGSFTLNIELAPDQAQGQYQGLAGSGMTLSFMLAPSIVAVLPLGLGKPGWLILGAVFVAAGFALTPVVAWAERTRDRYARPIPSASPSADPSDVSQSPTAT
jgi:MFS family permease